MSRFGVRFVLSLACLLRSIYGVLVRLLLIGLLAIGLLILRRRGVCALRVLLGLRNLSVPEINRTGKFLFSSVISTTRFREFVLC